MDRIPILKMGDFLLVTIQVDMHDQLAVDTIADNGQGIDNELLPHIFDRFLQGDSSTTRTHGGLGLGLAIARQLIELHGGSSAKIAGIGFR